jgi:hypothetical protein
MPRRNNNATRSRTYDRSPVKVKALRTSLGVTYVPILSSPTDDGRTLVMLSGVPTYVDTKSLINV